MHTPAGVEELERWRRRAERLRAQGEPLLLYDVVREGLERWPDDVRLRQLQALALADSGATVRAAAVADSLRCDGLDDEETLGLIARIAKQLWAASEDPAQSASLLARAAEAYETAYRRTGGYWTGINAATLARLGGDTDRASGIAREVGEKCRAELQQGASDPYWATATLGEAALVLGDLADARHWYARAAAIGADRLGALASTRRNARLLLDAANADPRWIDETLRVGRVTVFAGHMIDRPERASPRFPADIEGDVVQALRTRIKALDCRVGYASAACGADILFLEALLERGGEAHVVLPYERDQFMEDSVLGICGDAWAPRFERVLREAADVTIASPQRSAREPIVYDYANMLLHGFAVNRARQLETEMVPIAVWDGGEPDGPGGTRSAVERWQRLGFTVDVIDVRPFIGARGARTVAAPQPAAAEPPGAAVAKQVVAMLFADVVGFSTLPEEDVPRFVEHFLGAVGALIRRSPYAPVTRNTWGDGLYFVFDDVRDAGLFALDLCTMVASTDWRERGLSRDLELRIALHAGPAYACADPVTLQPSYFGSHVSRAARIEPVTPPGQIYGSQAFAALAAAGGVTAFQCDYVGRVPLAKGYGTLAMYHVVRR